MSLDQQGYFWLSNPWIAASAIVTVVGLLLWCHRSLAVDDLERSVSVPVRARMTPPTSGRDIASVRGVSCRVAAERERRDANRRRVA